MRVFINALKGVYRNAQYSLAEEGFNSLGIQTILYFGDEVLASIRREDILISTSRSVERRLAELGVTPVIPSHPEELLPYMDQGARRVDASEITEATLPAFIRPASGNAFPAMTARSMMDIEFAGVTGDVWLSRVERFAATWRCFIRYGTVLSIEACEGNPMVEPDFDLVREAAAAWTSAPAGCALDFGVTDDGGTRLLTTRDGWCLGPCGLDARSYALLIAARWAQMVGVEDELAGISR